mmetsp:Transcript_51768/g.123191  ORF Transcript_51768/g.123191 Transcript_51768/m.123191 type:complete len:355 (-) Transcript_51768:64-1128(-)
MATTQEVFQSIRSVAVSAAYCPLSLVELRQKPCEVGALVFEGRRVESVLYLRESVVAEGGILRLPGSLSPVSGEPVDGFARMPAIVQKEDFLDFVDWSGDCHTSAAEVAASIAAILPVEEENVERFIRERFDVDREGIMVGDELVNSVLPYLMSELGEFIEVTRVSEVPQLRRASPVSDFIRWFHHWDLSHTGELDHSLARFAIAVLFFKVLAGRLDLATKEVLVATFLEQVGLAGEGRLSIRRFEDCIVPALRANLPDEARSCAPGATLTLKLQSPWTGESFPVQVSSEATIADLRSRVIETWPALEAVHLYIAGSICNIDSKPLKEVPGVAEGAAVGVMPQTVASSSACTFA